jgi:hypothetical protein
MENKYTIPTMAVNVSPMLVKPPERIWTLYPCSGSYLRIELPHAPNAFHRAMQRIFLGFRYEKIKKGSKY